eukprot:995314_1
MKSQCSSHQLKIAHLSWWSLQVFLEFTRGNVFTLVEVMATINPRRLANFFAICTCAVFLTAYEDIMDRQRDRKRKREEDESNNGALPPQRRRLNGDENDEVMDVLSNNGRLTDDTMNMNAQRVHNEDVTSPSHTATQTRTIPETPEQPPMDTQYEQNNGHNTNNNGHNTNNNRQNNGDSTSDRSR